MGAPRLPVAKPLRRAVECTVEESDVRPFPTAIRKIGVNPYVLVARDVLSDLFRQAERRRGPIPVTGTLNRKAFTQTLVKFRGHWRLYINGPMVTS